MLLDVLIIPDSKLRHKAQKLTSQQLKSPEVQSFIDNLIETMKTKDGIGLAAVQVGKDWPIFCVATADGDQVFINTKIIKKSWRKQVDEEGCLSVPDVYGTVKRSENIIVKAQDRNGKSFTIKAYGLFARVIQHEYDHLQGVLFVDKLLTITKGADILQSLKNKDSHG